LCVLAADSPGVAGTLLHTPLQVLGLGSVGEPNIASRSCYLEK